MSATTSTALTGHIRRLLEAVKGACGVDGRWPGLLAGPMALLVWLRTRRMRKEIEAAAKQFVAMLEQLVVLLEEYRAGKLSEPAMVPMREEQEEATANPRAAFAPPRRTAPVRQPVAETLPPRFSAASAAEIPDRQDGISCPSPPVAGVPPDLIRGEGPAKREGEVSFCFSALRRIRSRTRGLVFFKRDSGERGTCALIVPVS